MLEFTRHFIPYFLSLFLSFDRTSNEYNVHTKGENRFVKRIIIKRKKLRYFMQNSPSKSNIDELMSEFSYIFSYYGMEKNKRRQNWVFFLYFHSLLFPPSRILIAVHSRDYSFQRPGFNIRNIRSWFVICNTFFILIGFTTKMSRMSVFVLSFFFHFRSLCCLFGVSQLLWLGKDMKNMQMKVVVVSLNNLKPHCAVCVFFSLQNACRS